MLTDLTPRQQAAALVIRLTGAARDVARSLSQPELDFGGVYNGVQVDPLTYVVIGLQLRFGQLSDESRLAAMNEFMAFR